eukprot:2108628-Pyramimonas_sp.AAC.1
MLAQPATNLVQRGHEGRKDHEAVHQVADQPAELPLGEGPAADRRVDSVVQAPRPLSLVEHHGEGAPNQPKPHLND